MFSVPFIAITWQRQSREDELFEGKEQNNAGI